VSDRRGIAGAIGVLALGAIAVLGGTLIGSADTTAGMASWPPVVRAGLVGVSAAIGLALLGRAVTMLAEGQRDGSTVETRDVRTMIRAVRLAFLAVAAFAAAGGFLFGQALLLVVAVVIAGVDVIETTFLLLVARAHHRDDQSES
jgi:hypothetical protein